MNLIGKLQPVIIITAALLGLLLGGVTPFGSVSSSLIEVFLMMLLYILFLSIDLKQIKKSFTNVRFTLSAVIINFVFTPLFGYVTVKVTFKNQSSGDIPQTGDNSNIWLWLLLLIISFISIVILYYQHRKQRTEK